MGQKHSRKHQLTLKDRIVLLLFVNYAIEELERDMEATDIMFKRLVDGLHEINVTRVGPEHVRRAGVQRGRRVQNLTVGAMMEDVALLDLAQEDEKGVG